MKVLLATHRYPPDGVGGVERYVESLKHELEICDDRVTVLTRTPTHWPRRPRVRRFDDVYRIVGSGVRLDEPVLHERKLDELAKLVMDEVSPDVVHVNHLIGLSPSLIPLARACGAVTVLTLHDYYFACPLVHLQKRTGAPCEGPAGGVECEATCFAHQPRDGRWPARAHRFASLLGLADVAIAPSESVAAYFERHTDGAVRPIVVANGTWARPPVVEPPAPKPAQLSVVMLGTVARHKGAHVVVEALRLAQAGRTRLSLWGRVDDRRYEHQVKALAAAVPGLALELRGEYTPCGLGDALSGADVVVVASQVREAAPIVPREALAHGVPVVVARVGGLPEAVIEGVNGMTFDPSKPVELADILARLARHPDLLETLARGARETEVRTAADNACELRELYVLALQARAARARI